MLKIIYSKNGGSASANTVAMVSAALILAAALIILAANIFSPKAAAYVDYGSEVSKVSTRSENINDFIAEQRAVLHPFDMITYAGSNPDGSFEIAVELAPFVCITDGNSVKNVRALKGETVQELLSRECIRLGDRDSCTPAAADTINGDCNIEITRAFPVMIEADGMPRQVLASGMSVGELLICEHVSLGGYDELNCDVDEPVFEGMTISISRVRYETRQKSEFIPYETVHRDSPLLKIGTSETVQEGVDGSMTVTIKDRYVDGVFVSSELVSTEKTDPVNEIIEDGTALNVPVSKREGNYTLKDGVPTEYVYVLGGKVTAYTSDSGADGTFSGRPLVIGSIGVDPDVIPFGSEVYIASKDGTHVYGYAVASDTGYIKGTGIIADVYMGSTEEHYDDACWWGAQDAYVYVLTVGDNSVSWR